MNECRNFIFSGLLVLSQAAQAADSCQDNSKALLARLKKQPHDQVELIDCMNPRPPEAINPETPDYSDLRSVSGVQLGAGEPSITLRYKYIPAAAPTTKTVIFFNGGPNDGIELGTKFLDLGDFPSHANLILLDYPGLGANRDVQVSNPDNAYSIEGAARYGLAVMQHEHLTDYVIYGNSWGTAAATVAAANIPAGMKPPRAVYLDAVVAKALPDLRKKMSDRTWDRLSASAKNKLQQKIAMVKKAAGGMDEPELYLLFNPVSDAAYFDWLSGLEDKKFLGCVIALAEAGPKFMAKRNPKYEGVGPCESSIRPKNDRIFRDNARFQMVRPCVCSKSKKVGSWDAARYRITGAPVFYHQADPDEAGLPIAEAKAHCANQSAVTKTLFYAQPKGPHSNALFACKHMVVKNTSFLDVVWTDMFAGNLRDWGKDMDTCLGKSGTKVEMCGSR